VYKKKSFFFKLNVWLQFFSWKKKKKTAVGERLVWRAFFLPRETFFLKHRNRIKTGIEAPHRDRRCCCSWGKNMCVESWKICFESEIESQFWEDRRELATEQATIWWMAYVSAEIVWCSFFFALVNEKRTDFVCTIESATFNKIQVVVAEVLYLSPLEMRQFRNRTVLQGAVSK